MVWPPRTNGCPRRFVPAPPAAVPSLTTSAAPQNALTFNLAAMLDHGAKPPGTAQAKQAASSFGFGMTIHV